MSVQTDIDRKGSLYTLEAAIAIVMMVTALAFFLQSPPEPQDLSRINYKLDVYNALEISEEAGDLRKNVLDNDASSIRTEINTYLSSSLNFNVTIYDANSNLTYVPDLGDDVQNIVTVSYFLAGWVGNYDPKEVRVFIWGFD